MNDSESDLSNIEHLFSPVFYSIPPENVGKPKVF